MKMKNPVREYRRLKKIVAYYRDSMQDLIRYKKYAQLGLLLLSNVREGDVVYLTGCHSGFFDQIHICIVKKVEFIGNNDANIFVMDIMDPVGECWGKMHTVKNSEYGTLFFTDQEAARRSLTQEGVSDVKGN